MSALKSDFEEYFQESVEQLEPPWCTILQKKTQTVSSIMEIIGNAPLEISGVHVKNQQYTLEKIASRLDNDVASFIYVVHGIVLSCITGELHSNLTRYARREWVPWILKANISGEPAFLYVCKRSLKDVATWMIGAMDECKNFEPLQIITKDGDTALHIAIRKKQWEWATWLVDNGVSPYQKNNKNETPIMLCAPHFEKIQLFKVGKTGDWFNALHDALVYGKMHIKWCESLLDMGADFNQPELYDAPLETLKMLAEQGMDMNLGPLPDNLSPEQRRVFYLYGHVPEKWQHVIDSFRDAAPAWPLLLYKFHFEKRVPERMKPMIESRRAISLKTIMQKALPPQ